MNVANIINPARLNPKTIDPELSPIRRAIVQECYEWEGTPYVDHAGLKGAGVDCAFMPLRVYQSVGLIDKNFEPPPYSPQAWLNSPDQADRLKLRHEDTTYLDIVKKFFHEIELREVLPGDLMLVQVVASWTHGAIVIKWPKVMHSIVGYGVCLSHALNEGFWRNAPKRYFSIIK